ncbi:hypothetical protein ABPG74_011452 [Tetrahymena malaccensis]
MKKLIFVLLISFCLAQSNLRNGFQMSVDSQSQCQKPCFQQKDQLLKGAALGYTANVNNDDKYITIPSSIYQNDDLYLCCDQQKTFDFLDGLIVPDFVDVKNLNLDDLNHIEASKKRDEQSDQFKIQINHRFQRVALQVSSNTQPQANMTTILQEIDPNSCQYPTTFTSWDGIFLNLGKTVVTSMYLGCEFSLNIYMSTKKNITNDEIVNIYWQHIQNNTLQTLCEKFEGCQSNGKSGWTRGVELLGDNQSFNSYLKSIGNQNYTHITPLKEFNIQNDLTTLNSYNLFDQQSQYIKECSFKQWKYRYDQMLQLTS